jgi:hypothetical protein
LKLAVRAALALWIAAACVPALADDLKDLLAKYGPPDGDFTTPPDATHPDGATRSLVYDKAGIKVVLIAVPAADPQHGTWKVAEIEDARSKTSLASWEGLRRLTSRISAGTTASLPADLFGPAPSARGSFGTSRSWQDFIPWLGPLVGFLLLARLACWIIGGEPMVFTDRASGRETRIAAPFFWALLFGPFYFASKGAWRSALVCLVVPPAWPLVYPFLARDIVSRQYLDRGWLPQGSSMHFTDPR